MSKTSEINALINLLDDPDEQIYSQIRSRLIQLGEEVIPSLETVWESNSFGVDFQQRIEDIIHDIQFENVLHGLKEWKEKGANDIIEGCVLVSKYQYPDLDEQKLYQELNQIERDVWIELHENLTAFEQVKVLNHIIFDTHGFTGNKKNYHAPQNSYLNEVLDSKRGNPITLSIIYMAIAQRLNIPIFGVNLPNHFVVCYVAQDQIMKLIDPGAAEGSVMFYINPFSRGTIFNKQEVIEFLKQLHLEPEDQFFEPTDNVSILNRVLTNLIYSYEKLGYPEKMKELSRLQDVIR